MENKNRNIKIYEENTLPPHSYLEYKTYGVDETVISLDGQWNFVPSIIESVDITSADFSSANIINVPSNIEMQGYFSKQYVNTQYPWEGNEKLVPPHIPSDNNIGLYNKTFYVEDHEVNDYILQLNGVESAFELYINDKYVGYSEDSHTPTEFLISEFLVAGINDIKVKVYKYSTASWLEDQDFWRIFGIHRSVNLIVRPKSRIEDVFFKFDLNVEACSVEINLETKTNNEVDYKANLFFGKELVLEFKDNATLNNINLWDVDNPNLYTLKVTTEFEQVELTVGFKKVEIVDSVIYINGKRIVFKGINRHDFSRKNGRAVTRSEMEWDIRFLKSHNFNAVRTSHYPSDSYLYELCNKYGIFVIDEANLETHGTWQNSEGFTHDQYTLPDDNPNFRDAVIKRGINMVERDKNHPSIIMWSCGNESFGGKTIFEMSQKMKLIDPSKLLHYEGIFWDRRYNDTSEVESRMYPPFHEIEEYVSNNPDKPYILCEYSHAMGNSNGNIHKYFELADKYDSFQGGFIWEMFEHTMTKDGVVAWGGDFEDRPTDYFFVVDGIVTGDRKVTPKAEYIKYVQQPFGINYEAGNLLIKNRFDYKDIENTYKVVVKSLINDVDNVICQEKLCIKNNEVLKLNIGEYEVVNVEIIDIENKYAFANNCVARKSFVTKVAKKVVTADKKVIKVMTGNVVIGIKGQAFHHMFSTNTNKFASIKYNGTEFINKMGDTLTPHFWRCPTNNDIGAGKNFELAKWRELSYNAQMKFIEIIESENEVIIKTQINNVEIYVDYHINVDGDIKVIMKSEILNDLPDMMSFGFRLNMDKKFSYCNYIGHGPHENYSDRCENMPFGIFGIDLENEYKYAVPQEYGNRTNVYSIEIFDEDNSGLKIISENPVEFSYKKYADEVLENYTHYGYGESKYNQLKIHSKMTGVAGDDSWGAWSWDEYKVKASEPQVIEFVITRR